MKNIIISILLIFFFFLSIISLYSCTYLLPSSYNDIYIKQGIWYILGFILIIIIYLKKRNFFYKYSSIIYYIGILLLVLVLFFGNNINGSKAWFNICSFISFQPSEFMKIGLIIHLSTVLKNGKNKFLTIIKCLVIVLIPSILTYLEPDTGNVIIYFIILFGMLFIYGIKFKYYLIISTIILITTLLVYLLYTNHNDLFINIFGTDIFYRFDRILDWKNKQGLQLENALYSIGSSPINGYGITKSPLYIPEAQTDFISSIIICNYGLLGSIFIILSFILFDITIIISSLRLERINKYFTFGFIGMILFQQIENISMNIGLLPITGITLPYISYGGSNLIINLILLGLFLNINKNKKKRDKFSFNS